MSISENLPQTVINEVAKHALAAGYFDKVNNFEATSAPGNNLDAAVWVQTLEPAASGLISTSVRFELEVRIYSSMFTEPRDMIDPQMMAAAWHLMTAYSANFTLGGLVESVDLLGKDGSPLHGEAGYVEIDRRMFRVFTITLSVKINDAFDQVP